MQFPLPPRERVPLTGCCSDLPDSRHGASDPRFRRALWAVLAINASMFAVEMVSGLFAHSISLQADALDFLGDSANYILTLMVLGMSMRWRSGAALVKGATMGLFGFWIIGQAVWNLYYGALPGAFVMGTIGFLALIANVASAGLLYAFRSGNANMRSVWLCSRNDAIGNVAVMVAAGGVFSLGSAWPDLLVALVMAGLALSSSALVIRQAAGELSAPTAAAE